MKAKNFHIVIILLLITTCIIFTFGIYLLYTKSGSKCPIQTCPVQKCASKQTPMIDNRDRRVISDPLYPALGRTDDTTFNMVSKEIDRGNLYQSEQDRNPDSFRLVGYLTNSENVRDASNTNNWKLFARMKDRHQGEFYIIPSNNNIDLKIPLTSDVVVGERLRDLYTLPKEMRFKSPMLNEGVYTFTELPKTDFTDRRYM